MLIIDQVIEELQHLAERSQRKYPDGLDAICSIMEEITILQRVKIIEEGNWPIQPLLLLGGWQNDRQRQGEAEFAEMMGNPRLVRPKIKII
jgi:hypothetical protein